MGQVLETSLKPDVFAANLSLFFVGFFHAEKSCRGNLNGKRAILVKPTPPSQKSLFIFSPELGGRSHFLAPAHSFFTNVLIFQVFSPFSKTERRLLFTLTIKFHITLWHVVYLATHKNVFIERNRLSPDFREKCWGSFLIWLYLRTIVVQCFMMLSVFEDLQLK